MTDSLSARSPDPSVADALRGMMRGFPIGVAVFRATDLAGNPWE